jgi:hypothetical protein
MVIVIIIIKKLKRTDYKNMYGDANYSAYSVVFDVDENVNKNK